MNDNAKSPDPTTASHFEAPLITLETWFHDASYGPLLDLSGTLYAQERLVVHIPLSELRARSFELPPREAPFVLYVTKREDLQALNRSFVGKKETTRKRPRRVVPWNITGVILDSNETRQQAKTLGILRSENKNNDSIRKFVVQGRLWQPDGLVQHTLLPLLLETARPATTARRKIWDLGAGAGRDAVYLAEELKAHGQHVRVVALDQRYRGDLTNEPCTLFMERRGLSADEAVCEPTDLHNVPKFMKRLESQSLLVECLLLVRFWQPDLLKAIASSPYLEPGLLVAISHFGLATAGSEWTFPHPKVSRGILICHSLDMIVSLFIYFVHRN